MAFVMALQVVARGGPNLGMLVSIKTGEEKVPVQTVPQRQKDRLYGGLA